MKSWVFAPPNIASKLFSAAAVASLLALAGCQSKPLLLRNRPNVPPPLIDPDDLVERTNVAAAPSAVEEPPPFQMDPVVTAPATPAAAPVIDVAPLTYTVKKRDSFWKISRMYGVSQQELASYNNMSLRTPLKVGTKLLIPPGGALKSGYAHTTPAPAPKQRKPRVAPTPRAAARPTGTSSDGFYIVQPRDSLWKIARRNHVSLKELEKANNLNSKSIIRPGMRLVIPGAGTAGSAASPSAAPPASIPPADENPYAPLPSKTTGSGKNKIIEDAIKGANEKPSGDDVSAVFDDDVVGTDDSSLDKAAKIAENASKKSEFYEEQILPSDTLEDIANRNGVTPEDIRALNPQIPPSGKLKPFTTIKIRRK